jgi:hypothetical protein
VAEAAAWTLAVTGAEWWWRRRFRSRARAWRATALVLLPAGLFAARRRQPVRGRRASRVAGFFVALLGYPLGRTLLADRSRSRPPDGLCSELLGLGLLTVAEELVWGRQVELVIGTPVTAVLFALKHAFIDGRWRRVLGLALFWLGLAVVRWQSPRVALLAHLAANGSGVVVGHWLDRDQF